MKENGSKEQSSIPVSKVKRAARMVNTGVKVGGNYLKYYTKKLVTGEDNKEALHDANAHEVYEALSELKGSALKAAQMLSMDQAILPTAFAEKFQKSQYSVPPLSYPLVVKTFQKHFNKNPLELFDSFSKNAVNAASIGQVHKATKGDLTLAIKVQYPGVAESVVQDLRMAKPIAAKIMQIKEKDIAHYMDEVQEKLLEETNYQQELNQSIHISNACKDLPNLLFPTYYPEWSSSRVLTMDWIDGLHVKDWVKTNPDQSAKNKVGQAIWDFYHYQIHHLRMVHADPHPGNFIITKDNEVGIIDFGCVKVIPDSFYRDFFQLLNPDIIQNQEGMIDLFYKLDFIRPSDSDSERKVIIDLLLESVQLLARPFYRETFDFGDHSFFQSLFGKADQIMKDKSLRKMNSARGSKDGIYINRTYFGLYSILHDIGATVATQALSAGVKD